MFRSVEGAEDSPPGGVDDLKAINLSKDDALVGIATSGRTPYVLGGLDYARSIGACAIGLSCNRDSALAQCADFLKKHDIEPVTYYDTAGAVANLGSFEEKGCA